MLFRSDYCITCDVRLASGMVLVMKLIEQSITPHRIEANRSHRELRHVEGNRRSGSAEPNGRRSDSGDRRRRRRTARMRARTNRMQNEERKAWGGRGAHGERDDVLGEARGAATAVNSTTAAGGRSWKGTGGSGPVRRCSSIPRGRRERGGRRSRWGARLGTGKARETAADGGLLG